MGDIPAGYDVKGLQPKIQIYDWDDSLVYTYEHSAISASPTKDFDLFSWSVSQGIATNFGSINLEIHDHSNVLTDLTSSRRPSKIKNEFKIILSLGKDPASLTQWFVGRIREGDITRLPQQQYLRLFSTGFGTLIPDRKTLMTYQQKRDATDPLALDSTDSTAKVTEILKSMYTDTENYVVSGNVALPFTVTGVDDIDIKIPNFDMRPATPMDSATVELANYGGFNWGIDYSNLDLWARLAGSASSGILVTNNLADSLTTNWDVDKLSFLLTRSRNYRDTTIGYAYPTIIAPGALDPVTDIDQTSSNALLDLSSKYFAIEFTPEQNNVWLIAPFVAKTGTPTKPLHVCLIGADASGNPDPNRLIQRRVITKEKLQALSGSGEYLMVEFDRVSITPNTQLFVYFEKYADATNNIDLDYQTGTGNYWDSTDGISFTQRSGSAKMRIYAGKTSMVIYTNTSLAKTFANVLYPKEATIPMNGIPTSLVVDTLIAMAHSRSRQLRIYDPITITPPKDPISLGKTVRYVDKFNGLDITADIVHYSMVGDAYNIKGSGVHEMTIEIEEPFAVV